MMCNSLRISPCFPGSQPHWEDRYSRGGNSGAGSYGRLADFKADFVNSFVLEHGVTSVTEFGCGDGNQLSLANYPCYVGLDSSPTAIQMCRDRFKDDASKKFLIYPPNALIPRELIPKSDLALSLDVIFHLVEDGIYEQYMTRLFSAAQRYVIVYSSNRDGGKTTTHVRHRRFTEWVSARAERWQLKARVENRYPFDLQRPHDTSFADFYIFETCQHPVLTGNGLGAPDYQCIGENVSVGEAVERRSHPNCDERHLEIASNMNSNHQQDDASNAHASASGMDAPLISVMLPSRNRVDRLTGAVESLLGTAADVQRLEILIRLDRDDAPSMQALPMIATLPRTRVITGERFGGYSTLHRYYHELAALASGRWLFVFGDDARMTTPGWDDAVAGIQDEMCLIRFEDGWNGGEPCFPIFPRTVFETLGHLSHSPHLDTWLATVISQYAGYPTHRFKDIVIHHDRPEFSQGAPSDETYR